MLQPAAPSAGPMGGAGLAFPAGSASLMIFVIFFAIIAGSATRCCLHTLRRCATLLLLLVALKDAECAGRQSISARASGWKWRIMIFCSRRLRSSELLLKPARAMSDRFARSGRQARGPWGGRQERTEKSTRRNAEQRLPGPSSSEVSTSHPPTTALEFASESPNRCGLVSRHRPSGGLPVRG